MTSEDTDGILLLRGAEVGVQVVNERGEWKERLLGNYAMDSGILNEHSLVVVSLHSSPIKASQTSAHKTKTVRVKGSGIRPLIYSNSVLMAPSCVAFSLTTRWLRSSKPTDVALTSRVRETDGSGALVR